MADPIRTAKRMFDEFLSKADPVAMPDYNPDAKDPLKQDAGRKGGKKGGKVRGHTLNAEQRVAIAREAARARWKDTRKSG